MPGARSVTDHLGWAGGCHAPPPQQLHLNWMPGGEGDSVFEDWSAALNVSNEHFSNLFPLCPGGDAGMRGPKQHSCPVSQLPGTQPRPGKQGPASESYRIWAGGGPARLREDVIPTPSEGAQICRSALLIVRAAWQMLARSTLAVADI